MAHRSRLAGFIIDCHVDDLEKASSFWSGALGFRVGDHEKEEGGTEYIALEGSPSHQYVAVQKVEHPSRVHLDIEADDIDAEAARLETLGAKRIGFVRRWWVMEAPTGQRFCVVKMHKPEQGPTPNTW